MNKEKKMNSRHYIESAIFLSKKNDMYCKDYKKNKILFFLII